MSSALNLLAYVDEILDNWSWGKGACKGCPYNLVDCEPDFASGDPDVDMMIVAQNPGKHGHLVRKIGSTDTSHQDYFDKTMKEAREDGWPWIQVLDSMVKDTRFETIDGVYWTNICKCHSYDEWNNELNAAIDQCKQYLSKEVTLANPSLIVTFGLPAAQAIIDLLDMTEKYGGKKMRELHGETNESQEHGIRVLFFSHWSWKDGEDYRNGINRRFMEVVNALWP